MINSESKNSFFIMILILSMGALLFLSPLTWMLLVSLKPSYSSIVDINPWSISQWDFKSFNWLNYKKALLILPFDLYAWNTLKVTILGIIGEVVSSSLIGYAFARHQFIGKKFLFILVLSTMMLPPQVIMVPLFILFRTFGWIDTLKPLIVPSFFGNAFSIFLFRQYFMTIPRSLDEAALIDGCSRFQIYQKILLPLSKPVIATVIVLGFLTRWNDYLWPLIYLSSQDNFTLALGLASFQGQYSTDWNLMMAASLVVMSPCLIIFFIAQKYLISGIVISGIRD